MTVSRVLQAFPLIAQRLAHTALNSKSEGATAVKLHSIPFGLLSRSKLSSNKAVIQFDVQRTGQTSMNVSYNFHSE